jgi:hypothetical protein
LDKTPQKDRLLALTDGHCPHGPYVTTKIMYFVYVWQYFVEIHKSWVHRSHKSSRFFRRDFLDGGPKVPLCLTETKLINSSLLRVRRPPPSLSPTLALHQSSPSRYKDITDNKNTARGLRAGRSRIHLVNFKRHCQTGNILQQQAKRPGLHVPLRS